MYCISFRTVIKVAQYNDDVRINKALENKINEVFDDTRFADAIYDLLYHKKIVYNNSIIWDKYKWDYPIKIGNTSFRSLIKFIVITANGKMIHIEKYIVTLIKKILLPAIQVKQQPIYAKLKNILFISFPFKNFSR